MKILIPRRSVITGAFGASALLSASGCREGKNNSRLFVAKSLEGATKSAVMSLSKNLQLELVSAGSQSIARQISATRRGDAVISADQRWIEWLAAKSLVTLHDATPFVRNQLVLVAHVRSKLKLNGIQELPQQKFATLMLGDPTHVPVGQYAKTALLDAGIFKPLSTRIATAVHARAALNPVVARPDHLAIVYSTDAEAESKVRIVFRFPPEKPEIQSFIAPLTCAQDPQIARELVAALQAPAAIVAYEKHGFFAPKATRNLRTFG